MSKQFESIMRGLQQVADYKNGDISKCRLKTVSVPDVEPIAEYTKEEIRGIRRKNNFTQKTFAEILGVTAKAVEAWEAGKRKPTGAAQRLFQIMEKNPSVFDYVIRH